MRGLLVVKVPIGEPHAIYALAHGSALSTVALLCLSQTYTSDRIQGYRLSRTARCGERVATVEILTPY